MVSGMRLNALDRLNFFLADVRGGLGAYVNVFLLTKAQWSQAAIGAVLSTSGLIGIMAHPAVGAFIDRTRAKRALIIAGAFVLSGCGLAIVWMPVLPVVLVADIIMAVLGGVFAPTVAAITLGLYGQEALPTLSAATPHSTALATSSSQSSSGSSGWRTRKRRRFISRPYLRR